MTAELKTGVQGRFGIKVLDPEGNCRFESEFSNLILDVGLARVANQQYSLSSSLSCRVGTGTNAPAVTNTGLQTPIGSTNSSNSSVTTSPSAPWWHDSLYEFTFDTASSNGIDGVSLSEIGIFLVSGDANNNTPGWSRELIRDGVGDPTTITLLPSEVLVVTYVVRVYPMTGDVTGTFDIGADTYDYVLRAANANDNNQMQIWPNSNNDAGGYSTQTLGSETGEPSGSTDDWTTVAVKAHVSEAHYRDYTMFANVGDLNFAGGLGSLTFGVFFGPLYQMSVAKQSDGTKIPKDADKTLTLDGFLRVTLSRYTP